MSVHTTCLAKAWIWINLFKTFCKYLVIEVSCVHIPLVCKRKNAERKHGKLHASHQNNSEDNDESDNRASLFHKNMYTQSIIGRWTVFMLLLRRSRVRLVARFNEINTSTI